MSVLSREHLTGAVEMRDVATLMELMTKTISSARYPPTSPPHNEKRWGKILVQVCSRVSQSDVNASTNFWSSPQAAGGKEMQMFSTFSSRMKMRILCCLVASVASQRLQAAGATVQFQQALPPCKAQTNQEQPQQVQPHLWVAAEPPGMPLLHRATVRSW